MRRLAFIDCRAPKDALSSLSMHGFTPIQLPPFSVLPEPLASHTDMLLFKAGTTLIFHADYCEEDEELFRMIRELTKGSDITLKFISDKVTDRYPFDAILNALVISDSVFCKKDTVSGAILDYARESGKTAIHVNQGYPACTVLKLTSSRAITADRGMARAIEAGGMTVDIIEEGGILLPPYKTGFIGGTAGVYGDKVYFVGRIEEHPSYNVIKRALDEEGLTPVSLGHGPLLDVGGICFTD